MAFGVVCAPPRRGLVIEIYINQGYKVQRQTLNFGLWDREPGVLTRIYQLTIADALTPSHKEKGVQWYGSHQHMGSTVTQLQHLNSDNFFQSLELFCRTISLTLDEPISNPFDFKLS